MASTLDLWAKSQYGRSSVLNLQGSEQNALVSYILELAEADVKFWDPRNKRMLRSQSFWEVGKRVQTRLQAIREKEDEVQESEVVELNDGYLIVDKITSMVAGATWGLNVPPKTLETSEVAQKLEDMLYWAEEELNAEHMLALNAPLIRDEVHSATMRGWICGLLVPNPANPELPWTNYLEDPLLVYPRYSRRRLLRVIHRYDTSVLEAHDDFPEAVEFFRGSKPDERVEITGYYDELYKMVLMSRGNTPSFNKGAESLVVQPLQKHGYVDIRGTPVNPWIIVTPRGTPFRQSDKSQKQDDIIASIGLDVLYPVLDIIERIEKLASQLHTEIAKGVDPPVLWYFDGVNPPNKIDLGIGATNYAVLNEQKVEILNTSSIKPDFAPFIELLTDRLQRGSVPNILYGQAAFTLAGYAINLLNQGARDVIDPILKGVQQFRQLRFRRMLEMYANADYLPPELSIRSRDLDTDQMFTGTVQVSQEEIRKNGVFVEVTYDSVLPPDKVQAITAGLAAKNGGLLSTYDIYTTLMPWIKSPKQALLRLDEDALWNDPEIRRERLFAMAEKTEDSDLKEAVARVRARLAAEAQQGGMNAQGSQPSPIQGVDSGIEPSNMQVGASPVPANIDPITALMQELQGVAAAGNAGAVPPDLGGF